MLTTAEILKKVKELEIKSKKLTTNVFSGEYHSAFKGRGMSFKEVREYAIGDDIRFIDWNTSARFGHPFSKVFEEERELTLMLLVDFSHSNAIGSQLRSKKEMIIEMAAILAFSAISNNDKVGCIIFSDGIEKFIAPKKGREHVLYMVRQLLTLECQSRRTDVTEVIRFFNRTMHNTSIAFMLSDFEFNDFEKALKSVAKRHDCIAVQVQDKLDYQLPAAGIIPLQDAESGELVWVDSNDAGFREWWQQSQITRTEAMQNKIVQCGWDYLQFSTHEDYVQKLQAFFFQRMKH